MGWVEEGRFYGSNLFYAQRLKIFRKEALLKHRISLERSNLYAMYMNKISILIISLRIYNLQCDSPSPRLSDASYICHISRNMCLIFLSCEDLEAPRTPIPRVF